MSQIVPVETEEGLEQSQTQTLSPDSDPDSDPDWEPESEMSSDPVDMSWKSFQELQTQFSSAATGQRKTPTTTAGQLIMTASQSQMNLQGPQGQVAQPIEANTIRPKGQSEGQTSHLLKQSEMPGAEVGPGGYHTSNKPSFPLPWDPRDNPPLWL